YNSQDYMEGPRGGGAPEAGSEGGSAATDTGTTARAYCTEANVLFCDDFDQGPFAARWADIRSRAGMPRPDGMNVSAPNSALFEVANAGANPVDSILLQRLPAVGGLIVEGDLKIDGRDNTAEMGFLVVGLDPNPPGLEYYNVGVRQAE